jgi:hypothetical protein
MPNRTAITILALAMLIIVLGCSAQPTAEETTAGPDTGTVNAHVANPGGSEVVTGTVVEAMDAAGYTYVRVDTGDGEYWAASNRFAVEVGEQVTFPLETPMSDFHSESLDRDFPLIYFVSYVVPEGEAPQPVDPATTELPPGHPPLDSSNANAEQGATIIIEAPGDGMTIADVWMSRVDLAGTQVTVRGRVVKFNAGILGRNWFHIQDGSGEVANGSNDLTVTTEAAVAVGDIVTATGIVAIDRDFGAGYTYSLMLEEATVTR